MESITGAHSDTAKPLSNGRRGNAVLGEKATNSGAVTTCAALLGIMNLGDRSHQGTTHEPQRKTGDLHDYAAALSDTGLTSVMMLSRPRNPTLAPTTKSA